MTLVASGNPIALKDAGTNTGGGTTFFIDDTFTAGSATNKTIQGSYTEYDEENEEETTVTEDVGTYTVYGYNAGTTSGTTVWRNNYQWADVGGGGIPWDDEGDVVPTSNLGAIGSGLTTTYTDGGGTSRTVVTAILADDSNGADNGPDQFLMLGLAGTTAPDTDNTFKEFQWGGLTVTRASADHVGTTNGCKFWIWELTTTQQNTAGASTGTKDFELIQTTGGVAPNNGIVEEFGDTTGAPHSLSEFYKGGANVSSNVTASIPTSGTIKFSDFYGAAFAASEVVHHTTTFYPDYLSIFNYGSYIKYGGYNRPGAGFQTETGSTPADIDFDPNGVTTFMGHTTDDVDIEGVYTYYASNSDSSNWQYFEIRLEANGSSLSSNNTIISSNFSKIEVYDGNTTSGTPLISADVSNADATGTLSTGGGSTVDIRVRWTPANVTVNGAKTFANVFGTNTTASNNGIHTIKIIK